MFINIIDIKKIEAKKSNYRQIKNINQKVIKYPNNRRRKK